MNSPIAALRPKPLTLLRLAFEFGGAVSLMGTLGAAAILAAGLGLLVGVPNPYFWPMFGGVVLVVGAVAWWLLLRGVKGWIRSVTEDVEWFLRERRLGRPDTAIVFTDTPQAKAHVEASQAAQQHQQRRYDDATMTLYRMKHHPRVARACAWLEAFGIDPYVEPIGGHYMRHHFEGHHTEVSIRWISECLSAAAEKLTSAR